MVHIWRRLGRVLRSTVPFPAGVFAILLLSACGAFSEESYRYRMAVEVDTPQGVRAGSAVIEVIQGEGIAFPGPEAGGVKARVRGEAVAVDLPGGQTLFALLRSPGYGDAATSLPLSAYIERYPELRDMGWREQIEFLQRQTQPAELPKRGIQ